MSTPRTFDRGSALSPAQAKEEIRAGLRWPDGRALDYDRDDYFVRHPLALTLPRHMRTKGGTA